MKCDYRLRDADIISMVENEFANTIYKASVTYPTRLYFDLAMMLIKYEEHLNDIKRDGWAAHGTSKVRKDLDYKLNSELKAIGNLKQLKRKYQGFKC